MKKVLLILLPLVLLLSLLSCGIIFDTEEEHEHTFEYNYCGIVHLKQYTCGCPSEDIKENHYDNDQDNKCDACSGLMKDSESVLAAYYLPYTALYTPISLKLLENGKCVFEYFENRKEPYYCNYWIENGKVYFDIETGPKVHVFDIFNNALIFNDKLSTANLWDTDASRGPVIYFLEGFSENDMLSAYVMAEKGSEAPAVIEEIYAKYEREMLYEYNTKSYKYYVYVVLVGGDEASSPWSENIIGTDYTFTYPDNSQIWVINQGMVLTLNEALDRNIITLEALGEFHKKHNDCSIEHSYDQGVITEIEGSEQILYTCIVCQNTKTISLPNDFSFSLTFGFDGKYDSVTGHLETGYNYDLGVKCETTLLLDHNELMNIYRIFYNGGLFEIKDSFGASNQHAIPSYNIKISYTVDGETVNFTITGASYISYSQWEINSELAYYYNKVITDFIKSSEEYKALPPNQNIYE